STRAKKGSISSASWGISPRESASKSSFSKGSVSNRKNPVLQKNLRFSEKIGYHRTDPRSSLPMSHSKGKFLVIVESPAKIKTLRKFLGSNYSFESSVGHIRDLPQKGFGIDLEADFEP